MEVHAQPAPAVSNEYEEGLYSIIIPLYNRKEKIARCISSVQQQTLQNFEIVVVDDASTDTSAEIVDDLAAADRRIRLHRSTRNAGAAASRNIGFKIARGEFISLLDSDDVFHPEFLAATDAVITQHRGEPTFTRTGVRSFYDEDPQQFLEAPAEVRRLWQLPEKLRDHPLPYLYGLQFGTSAGITVTRPFLNTVGLLDDALHAAEDTDWFIRASATTLGVPIDRVLVFKDKSGEDRLTRNYQKLFDAYEVIYAKHKDAILDNVKIAQRISMKIIQYALFSGHIAQAEHYYRLGHAHGAPLGKARTSIAVARVLGPKLFMRAYLTAAKLKKDYM